MNSRFHIDTGRNICFNADAVGNKPQRRGKTMARDVGKIKALLDAEYQQAMQQDKQQEDLELLQEIGAEEIRKYLGKLTLKRLHAILRGNGYQSSLVVLRDQLAAMGVRDKQARPEILHYNCRVGGCDGKLVQQDNGQYKCGKCKAVHAKQGARIVLVKGGKRKSEELVQVSMLGKDKGKPQEKVVEKHQEIQEKRQINIKAQGVETPEKQNIKNIEEDVASLFGPRSEQLDEHGRIAGAGLF